MSSSVKLVLILVTLSQRLGNYLEFVIIGSPLLVLDFYTFAHICNGACLEHLIVSDTLFVLGSFLVLALFVSDIIVSDIFVSNIVVSDISRTSLKHSERKTSWFGLRYYPWTKCLDIMLRHCNLRQNFILSHLTLDI